MTESRPQDQQFTNKKALWPFMKRLFTYALNYKKTFYGFMVAVIIVGCSDAAFPLLWMYFLDDAVTPLVTEYKAAWDAGQTPAVDMSGVWFYAGLFLLNGIIQVTAVFFFIKNAGRIEESVMFDLREQMFGKLQELSFSYYDKSASGWLLSRISSDAERVTKLISWGFLDLVWGCTMIILCLSAMFFYHWKMALIVAVCIPLLILLSVRIRMLILRFSREARKINSELTAGFNEHLNGVEVNKITAQEERVTNEFSGLSNRMRRASFSASYYTAMYMPLVIGTGSVAAALILFYGGHLTIESATGLTVGVLTAFFLYARQIFWPILDIARFYAMAQGSLSAGERIFSLIDEKPDLPDREGASDYHQIEGAIEFEQVDFSYVEGKPVLQDLNLKIEAGTSLAIVGATGGGKSTIINLIGRFYEPNAGTIKIDGIDYMDRTKRSLRSQLGVVLQTPHLFSGSVRDNVRYGRYEASDADIENALRSIGAEDFIPRLDDEVGEGGEQLSMGERQLLSFARAILTNPRIVIMDEATSSIDTLTEARIQKSVAQLIEGRTAIIIAHRLSTIRDCDRIIVLKAGQIIEDGSHDALMVQKGYYHSLYTKQIKRKHTQNLAEV